MEASAPSNATRFSRPPDDPSRSLDPPRLVLSVLSRSDSRSSSASVTPFRTASVSASREKLVESWSVVDSSLRAFFTLRVIVHIVPPHWGGVSVNRFGLLVQVAVRKMTGRATEWTRINDPNGWSLTRLLAFGNSQDGITLRARPDRRLAGFRVSRNLPFPEFRDGRLAVRADERAHHDLASVSASDSRNLESYESGRAGSESPYTIASPVSPSNRCAWE